MIGQIIIPQALDGGILSGAVRRWIPAHGQYLLSLLLRPRPPSTPSPVLRKTASMADNSTDTSDGGIPDLSEILPPYLNLPPHLSAHKYFFVCTLTVAAWDTLVLSPRTWRLLRTKEWPPLKILFHFLRLFMPIEFTIVGASFSQSNSLSSLLMRVSIQASHSLTPNGHKM